MCSSDLCGRPVVTVPGAATGTLVQHGVSGYLIPNEPAAWLTLLKSLPGRDRLAGMGLAAAQASSTIGWDKTARRYFELCQELAGLRG